MPDRADAIDIRERLLSDDPTRFAFALRDVLLHGLQVQLLTFRDAARVSDVGDSDRPREALVELVLALAEWPTPPPVESA